MTNPLSMQVKAGQTRRFQINPEPLKLREPIPQPDYDAGRCDAFTEDGKGPRCLREAVEDVDTISGIVLHFCRQHAKRHKRRWA